MKNFKFKDILGIQSLILLYSFVSVLSKVASEQLSKHGLFSIELIAVVFAMGIALVVYAFFWQRVLKKVDLSVAYVNKGMLLFWSLIWSVILFSETITIPNLIGTIVIVFGILVVTKHE